MTIKEFSAKYAVPYHIAYGATYKIHPTATMQRDKDFPEQDMVEAVTEVLTSRIAYHLDMMEKDSAILKGMVEKA